MGSSKLEITGYPRVGHPSQGIQELSAVITRTRGGDLLGHEASYSPPGRGVFWGTMYSFRAHLLCMCFSSLPAVYSRLAHFEGKEGCKTQLTDMIHHHF